MSESSSMVGLIDFKKQLYTLSESLNQFDPVERTKALEILHECIEDLENKNNFSVSEDSSDGVKEGPDSSPVKDVEFEKDEDSGQELDTSNEKVEDDESEYILKSDVDCESASEEESKPALKCPKCGEEFEDKKSLLQHMQSYSGKLKSCAECQKVFQNSVSFKFHKQLQMCLKSSKVYKCRLCNKRLYGGSQYNIHMSAHKRNQCKMCGDHFAKQKHLEAHMINIHNSRVKVFRCDACNRTFMQRRSLVYHYKTSHADTQHVCLVCLEACGSASALEAHQASHKQLTLACSLCDQQFSRRQQYLVHIKEHEKYKCETCSENFSAKKKAEKHARLGHSVTGLQLQLQCAECGELFFSRPHFQTHMEKHTGGKKLSCKKCKMTFSRERNYLNHLQSMEHLRGEESKVLLLPCKYCDKTFTNINNLRAHVSRMHREGLKEYGCDHCSYKTTQLSNFRRHMAGHTEKPSFICDKCGSQHQSKNALLDHHQQVHNENRDFSCEKCGKTFVRASELKRHLANVHSDVGSHACHCGNIYKTGFSLRRHQSASHGDVSVQTQQNRLKKLFPTDKIEPPKKKQKKSKTKPQSRDRLVDELQMMDSKVPSMSSTLVDSGTVVLMTDRQSDDLLEVAYDMEFTHDKSHIIYTENLDEKANVYSENLDIGGLQVVESMIQLDSNHLKQGASVLINMRNMFGRPLANEYIMSSPIEPSLINSLGDSLSVASTHIPLVTEKQDVMAGLQDYITPHDLGFLNV